MAKLTLSELFQELRGSIGGFVVKRSPQGMILQRAATTRRKRWSPAQVARRELMKQAARHYRDVMADPQRAAKAIAAAKKKHLPVSTFVMAPLLKSDAPGTRTTARK